MFCIETKGLTHRFGRNEIALNRVALQVQQGTIYGFLGPNGAGKTTTLKLCLGLLRKQEGEVLVFGKEFMRHRVECLGRIGSLIETPSFYEHLTAFENLRLLEKIYQTPRRRIGEVLELVGLPNVGSKRTGKFSLGMKQRLGIAMALMHQPTLLILDEPTNGLDPNGMVEMRELLQRLNRDQGITVLVSSHLLSEVEKLVTHVGIINRGELLFQGPLTELVQKQHATSRTEFTTSDNHLTSQIIRDHGISVHVEFDRVRMPVLDRARIAAVNERLVKNNIAVYQIKTVEKDLETIFFELIGQ